MITYKNTKENIFTIALGAFALFFISLLLFGIKLYSIHEVGAILSLDVLARYYEFVVKFITFNLGYSKEVLQKSINQVIIDRSWITFKLVTSSIVLSFVIATLLAGWKLYIESKLRVLTRNIQLFFYFVISTISIAPAFWVASILFNFIHIFGEGNNTRVKLLFAILVLTVCDGNLAYLADGIKQKWSELLSKEFIKYADVRGLNLFDKIFKHFFPHIIGQMLILLRYRIIYFISAAVIVEMIYSILGVGFLFIEKGWGSEDAYTPLAILFYLAIIIGIYNAFVAFFIEKEERYCKIVNFYVSIASRLRDGLSPLILFLIKKQLIIKRLLLSAIILSILISIVVIMPNANKVESVSESEVVALVVSKKAVGVGEGVSIGTGSGGDGSGGDGVPPSGLKRNSVAAITTIRRTQPTMIAGLLLSL